MRALMTAFFVCASLLASLPAHATYYSLVSCDYEYVPEIGRSKYIGTYRSQYGNLWTGMFDSYCPASLNM